MNCTISNCNQPKSGNSKYCTVHKKEAREAWIAMIASQKAEQESLHTKFAEIYQRAIEAGEAAMQATVPTPMVVSQHASPMDDSSPVTKQWHVPQGACGFAWVSVSPGNCKFANWLKKNNFASRAYGGGVKIWIDDGGQSVELKSAYAGAMARVLNKHLDSLQMPAHSHIYSQSRLD